ncbi:MAG: hypothetical protein RI953_3117, partial [Pseudomonadota bacterium]
MLPERNTKYKFLPPEFDPENADMVRDAIHFLKKEVPEDFESAARWYGNFQELSDATNEVQTRFDLLMSLDSQNSSYLERLQRFEREILSQLIESRAELMDVYLNSCWRGSMHADDRGKIHSEIVLRRRFASVELGPLQIEENQMVREFKNFSASATCLYFGRQTPIGIV